MTIENIFIELESASTDMNGILQRRILSGGISDSYIGITRPTNQRVLKIQIPHNGQQMDLDLPNFKVILISQETTQSDFIVTLRTTDSTVNDVFSALVKDVLDHISQTTDSHKSLTVIETRLLKWQRLLQKNRWTGLSDEEQRGLYGELCILRDLLLPNTSTTDALESWTGVNGSSKDFELFNGTALESKSSISKLPYSVSIANERQLDESGYESLFLIVRHLDINNNSGETLIDRIESIRSTLHGNPKHLLAFEDKLETAGYSDVHAEQYKKTKFTTRELCFYQVFGTFPRLTEASILNGIGNVRYSIDLSACQSYLVSETDLLLTIKGTP